MIPTSTIAAILVEQKQDLVIDTVGLPTDLEAGQVLVQVDRTSICGSQLGEIDGVKGPDRWLPHLLGHEGSAQVLAVGPGVKHVEKGQHVVMHWRKSRGIDAAPARYSWQGMQLNAGQVTTFNRYSVVSENRLTPVSKDYHKDLAALMGCAITTGFGAITNDAAIKLGENLVIFGAGGVGLNMIQAAKLSGAGVIIAVDIHQNRLELASELGATHCINSKIQEVVDQIRNILGNKPLDVFLDNTGQPAIIELGYRLIQSKGRIVLVGVPRKGRETSIYTLPLHFGKSIVGSEGGQTKPDIDIPRYSQLFERGLVDHDRLISERYELNQINEAIGRMRDGSVAGRVMLDLESL